MRSRLNRGTRRDDKKGNMADIANLVEELSKLTVIEAADLVKKLEEKWGVTAAAPVAVAAAPAGGAAAPAAEAKTTFDVILVSAPADKKIATIKAVRESRPVLAWRKPRRWWKARPSSCWKALRKPMPTRPRRSWKKRAPKWRSSNWRNFGAVVREPGPPLFFTSRNEFFISYKQQQQATAGSGLSSGKFTVERSVLALCR